MPRRARVPSRRGARRVCVDNCRLTTDNCSAKRRGELAELIFLTRASALGLIVSKPYGDSAPYDFVVGYGRKLSRVQVRSGSCLDHGAYRISTAYGCRWKIAYTADQIDLLAAYIVPLDTWYLIPVRAFSPRKTIWLRPGSPGAFERFHECWGLLQRAVE